MKPHYLLFWLGCCLVSSLSAQQRQPVVKLSNHMPSLHAFTNCYLVVSPDKQIEGATLLIEDGLIRAVGKEVPVPSAAVVHDLKGMWVYPGFIDAATKYNQKEPRFSFRRGAPQFESKREGPYHWNEAVKAHKNLAEDFKTDPKAAESMRKLGFTTANVLPIDGIFRGQGTLVHLGDGKVEEEMLVAQSCSGLSFRKGSSKQAYPNSLMGAIALIRQTLIDAQHYDAAEDIYAKNPQQEAFSRNLDLESWNAARDAQLPIIMEGGDYLNTMRAAQISKEFSVPMVYLTSGESYQNIDAVKALNASLIVGIDFPAARQITTAADAADINLNQLRSWEQAPTNPSRLAAADIPFALTTYWSKDPKKFHAMLRKAIRNGLKEADALAALTTTPAGILGVSDQMGTLEVGKKADFLVVSGNVFDQSSNIHQVYVAGKQFELKSMPDWDPRGTWTWELNGQSYRTEISGSLAKPKLESFLRKEKEAWKTTWTGKHNRVDLSISKDSEYIQVSAIYEDEQLIGYAEDDAGKRSPFSAKRTKVFQDKANKKRPGRIPTGTKMVSEQSYPNGAFGLQSMPEQGTYLIQGATVWTNTDQGILEKGAVLVENGKIKAVGTDLNAPEGAQVIDGSGMHLTPGIIDEHTHIAISMGVNEGTHSVTSEVRIGDVIDPEDIDIYRQLSGGVTTAQCLHGSANPIGGQSAIIKLRWGGSAEDMKFKRAPGFIKFALGENVKRSSRSNSIRYPQTRMGVEQMMQDAFRSAKDYKKELDAFERIRLSKPIIPPKRDLQLETLVEILEGKRFITCHSYVQSEINMLMKLAESEGFKVNTFTHILEGYKVADKMAKHGATGSTFSDWWAYKYEVIDAIPHNAALMNMMGVNVCINSDNAEMARRLNQEAAKAVKYGGVSEEDALKMVTLNPAKALHIEEYVGSLEVGKDADLVLWNHHPLSIYARPRYTMVDGRILFDQEKDRVMQVAVQRERQLLVNKMMKDKGAEKGAFGSRQKHLRHGCEDEEIEYLRW
ncbi:MAG: amidohydrolase family protein [Bacteroidota bacterium]